MNGVHDMGGMHGMGPIQYESNEPVFHEPWEARVFALNLAGLALGKWTPSASKRCRGCRKTRASRCLPSLGRPRRSRWR